MDVFSIGQLVAAPYLIAAGLAMPLVLYVIARWRAHREQVVDPQLGLKVALGYFAATGLQIALAGLAALFYAVLSGRSADDKSDEYRRAFGLLLPGAIVLAAHVTALRRTNQDRFTGVRRLFAGYNLLVTGTLGLVALVLAFEALFARSSGELGRIAGAMVLVYGSAWAVVGVQLGRLALGEPDEHAPAPSAPPPPAAPANEGPKLPVLGDGFPPIGRKDHK